MFGRDWEVLRQVPEESGAAGGAEAPPPEDKGGEAPPADGPGSGRGELRQQLEKNFEADRKATEKVDKAAAKKAAAAPKRVAGGAEVDAGKGVEPEAGEGSQQQQQNAVAAPEGLSAEAKAEWAKTPPAVQQAVAKRLADSAKGVEELKGKYAELDKAIAPHMDAIRRYGTTPAKAVENLFLWFQALANNPVQAFPALAQQYNIDLTKLVAAATQGGQQQQQPGAAENQIFAGMSPEQQKYFTELQAKLDGLTNAFSQRIDTVQSAVQRQAEDKTNEILAMWSKDKPYYDKVRGLMANLIASGSIPLKNGQVDLDGAYEMAIYANPEVRVEIFKAQQEAEKKAVADKAAAEKKAQQEQAEKARRAAVSVSAGAPGNPAAPGKPANTKRKSVRESIMEAREQLTEQ